jgi:L-rhamnose mutarotase
MFDRIQNIQEVIGNNNIIINGDITVDSEVLTKVANQLLKTELNNLTLEAKEQMQGWVNEGVQSVLNQMVSRNIVSNLSEFSRPSTQFAFYTMLKGYSYVETIEQRDLLVDAFIDRIQTNWDSSEKMIIDSALEVLPKLSPQALSTIGLLQIRHQLVNTQVRFMLHQYFANLTPLVEKMSLVTTLDIEYLKQERLILPLPGLNMSVSLEEILLTHYDLFFRHSLKEGVYDEYCRMHPEAREAVSDNPIRACMMYVDGTRNNETSFCCVNSSLLIESLKKRHQEYIIPHVEALKRMMPPFTKEEIRNYFLTLSPSWERLFRLFSTECFRMYTLSITGNYIGGKILAKVCHSEPLTLTDYKKNEFL